MSFSVLSSVLLFAAVRCLFDFEAAADLDKAEIITCTPGCRVELSGDFATSGVQSLLLYSSTWRSPADKCVRVRFPVSADLTGFSKLVVDARIEADPCCFDVNGYLYLGYANGDHDEFRLDFSRSGSRQFVFELPKRDRHLESVTFVTSRPQGEIRAYFDRVLLATGSPAQGFGTYIDQLEDGQNSLELENRHLRDYLTFSRECHRRDRGESGGILVGTASSMRHVRPKGPFQAEAAEVIRLALAGNEKESFQLVVAGDDRALEEVEVEVTPFELGCQVSTVGYLTGGTTPHRFKIRGDIVSMRDWWPDPLLDFPLRVDIPRYATQSFWVRLAAPAAQRPGIYRSRVRVRARGLPAKELPLEVEVYGFSLAEGFPLPLAVCSSWPQLSNPDWCDFLYSYRIPADTIYLEHPVWSSVERMKRAGRLGPVNLGWFEVPRKESEAFDLEEWKRRNLPRFRASYEKAKELGLQDRCYIYACDELPKVAHGRLRAAREVLRKELPGVPVLTTAFECEYGAPGTALDSVDWFCPQISRFVDDLPAVEKARVDGKKIWWYICWEPSPPYVNALIQCPPVDLRALMGAMTAKYRPDGFLYWWISNWKGNQPITEGPYVKWNPCTFQNCWGDGNWTYPGPEGRPLASIRLENFRDGVEDLLYIRAAEALGLKAEIPDWLVRSPRDYSLDPADYYRWREALARRIVDLSLLKSKAR